MKFLLHLLFTKVFARIHHNSLLNYLHIIIHNYMHVSLVPGPSVTINAPSNQTVGQSLTLESSITTVRGITSRVDIVCQ